MGEGWVKEFERWVEIRHRPLPQAISYVRSASMSVSLSPDADRQTCSNPETCT